MPIALHGLQALRMDLPSPTHLKLNPGPQQLLLLRGLHSDGLSFFLRLHWVWPSLLCPPAGHWPRCHRSDSVDSRRTVVPTCYSVRVSSGCHNYLRLRGLNNRHLLSQSSGNWKSKTRMLADVVLGEGSLLGLQMATFLLCVYVQ